MNHEDAAGANAEGAELSGEAAASNQGKVVATGHRRRIEVARRQATNKLTTSHTILHGEARLAGARVLERLAHGECGLPSSVALPSF
jgi:hypothetical protein